MRAFSAVPIPRLGRRARFARLGVGAAASVAALAALASAACTTSGNIHTGSGFLPDGAPIPEGEGGVAFACVFDELDTFTCSDLTLAPSGWAARCVDDDDCTTRVKATTTAAGCTDVTEYANVRQLASSCATWQASGGTLPSEDGGPAPVCAPGSAAGFMPAWHAPRPKMTSCTSAQVDSYLQCLTDATTTLNPGSCTEWTGALSASDDACLTCLSSNESDSTYGPLVRLPTELLINVAGCIALAEGKADGSGCGGALQSDEECERAVCLPTCPTATTSQLSAEQSCETDANQLASDGGAGGVCATYALAATCAGAIELDGGSSAAAACFGGAGGGASAQFKAVALAFCGP